MEVYPLVMTNIAMENGHTIDHGDLNHSYVSHYQRVLWMGEILYQLM